MAGPAHLAPSLSSSSFARRMGAWPTHAGAPRPPPASPCRRLLPPNPMPGDVDEAVLTPLPLLPWPFSPLPPRSSPEQRAVAVVHRTPGHRPPLALPLSLEAPPCMPCPLHRATRRRRPCFVATVVVFTDGHRRSPAPIHRLQAAPEPTDLLCESTVRFPCFSPLP